MPEAVFPTYSDLSPSPPPSGRCRSSRRRSSSACSSGTRTSTASPRRGGGSPPRVPERAAGRRRQGPAGRRRSSGWSQSCRAASSTSRSFRPRGSPAAGRGDGARAPVALRGPRPRGDRGFARGRGVVATRAGGILDLVEDGEQGLLVEPGTTAGLADALVARALRPRARRAARRRPRTHASPSGTRRAGGVRRARMRELVETALN